MSVNSLEPVVGDLTEGSRKTFKFLARKPIGMFKNTPQFLQMLQAEQEGLLNIVIEVPDPQIQQFAGTMVRCVRSMDYGEVSTAWNELREAICYDVVRTYLVPSAAKWVKEHLRGEAEEFVAERCRMELEFVSETDLSHKIAQSDTAGKRPSLRHATYGARGNAVSPCSHQRQRRFP